MTPAPNLDCERLRRTNEELVERVFELEHIGAERQRLVVELLSVHEAQRGRIADQLHDDSIQAVSSVGLRLDILAMQLAQTPAQRDALVHLRDTVTACVSRLRRSVVALKGPSPPSEEGLAVALRAHLGHVEREAGLAFELEQRDWREPFAGAQRLLYALVREAVENVRKHASASLIRVSLQARDGTFIVRIEDDGVGFDVGEALRVRPGRVGLPSMREQLEIAGGSLRVESVPGRGSLVQLELPELVPIIA